MKDSYLEELLDNNGWKLEDIDIIQRGFVISKMGQTKKQNI